MKSAKSILHILLRKELALSFGFGFYAFLIVKVIPELVRRGDSGWAVVILAMMGGLIVLPILAWARRTVFLTVPTGIVASAQIPGLTVNLGLVGPKQETGESGLAWFFFKLSETELGWPSAAIVIAGLVGYAWHIHNESHGRSTPPAAAEPLEPDVPLKLPTEASDQDAPSRERSDTEASGDRKYAVSNAEAPLDRRAFLSKWVPTIAVLSIAPAVVSWVSSLPPYFRVARGNGQVAEILLSAQPEWAGLPWIVLLLVVVGGVLGPIAILVVRTVADARGA